MKHILTVTLGLIAAISLLLSSCSTNERSYAFASKDPRTMIATAQMEVYVPLADIPLWIQKAQDKEEVLPGMIIIGIKPVSEQNGTARLIITIVSIEVLKGLQKEAAKEIQQPRKQTNMKEGPNMA